MLLVSESEFTLMGGFMTRSDKAFFFFFLFLFVSQCKRTVPGFECLMRLSFQCDEVQVLVVRGYIHKAY